MIQVFPLPIVNFHYVFVSTHRECFAMSPRVINCSASERERNDSDAVASSLSLSLIVKMN